MKATLLTRRYLLEYARRPLNLVLLLLVPLVFVVLVSGALGDFAKVIGGVGDPGLLAAPSAGWAAGFLAGVAGFFHVLGSRNADRRLASAGFGPRRIVTARLISGVILALLAAASALVALAARTGLADPVRAIAGSVMFAVIYLAIGVAVGSVIRNEVNGSLVVIFVWMLDVFLGPAMAGGDVWVTRLFPTHFVTLLMLDAPSGHAGSIGDVGWALLWTVGALLLAAVLLASATKTHPLHWYRGARWASVRRAWEGLRYGMREYRRNIAMWVLLAVLPVFFISLSFVITPDQPAPVELSEGGVTTARLISMTDLHGAIMVPITIAFLAGLAGLFVIQASSEADRRLVIAGFRTREILVARLGVIGLAGLIATGVSLAITAIDFTPGSWMGFTVGNVLVAVTYGLVGVLIGSLFGRLGGLYLMFLLPFIDVGLAQNVMFSAVPPAWGAFLPARGAMRVLVNAAFTPSFDQIGNLLLALGWVVALGLVAALVLRRTAGVQST
ncbi:MAG: ABC transporter permease [Actinobacteria bacterium]|nr:ABC transporter permease [Actinomycetota bacterium]